MFRSTQVMQRSLAAITARLFQLPTASGGVVSICVLITTLQDMRERAGGRKKEANVYFLACNYAALFARPPPSLVLLLHFTFTLNVFQCVCLVSDGQAR